ncbi:hypothetical protein JMJ35_002453 [Cladonia borealis]|uniref:Bromo domain-containing protein n=1 Tax=Cladonia borealis TaxID=184061 RepID=A0AA39R7F0_9LECA|nr:hypothetical protein JMJ35_002453 [Cladonia borealis]
MARMITVDCIGSNVLSITDDYATHSVPLSSQVIHISEQSGETKYRLNQLPLTYEVDTLGGRFNIHDGKNRLIYCWRSHEQHQRQWRSPSLARRGGHRSRSPRGRAPAGVETMRPVSNRTSAHMQSGTSERQRSTTRSSLPFPTSKEYESEPRPDLNSKSGNYDSFKIRREDASVTKNDPVDLTKDEKDCRAPAMTAEQKKILRQITASLMITKTSLHFQKPLRNGERYFMVDNDGYTVEKEPMGLRTLQQKLIHGSYVSLQEYKRDFRLIIDTALQRFPPDSEIAKDAQALNAKFEEHMMFFAAEREDLGDETPRRTRERRPRAA